jgi:hypothetical protein
VDVLTIAFRRAMFPLAVWNVIDDIKFKNLISESTVHLNIKCKDLYITTHNKPDDGHILPKHVLLRDST